MIKYFAPEIELYVYIIEQLKNHCYNYKETIVKNLSPPHSQFINSKFFSNYNYSYKNIMYRPLYRYLAMDDDLSVVYSNYLINKILEKFKQINLWI